MTDDDELPEGWALTTLEHLGQWQTGGTPSRKRPDYFGGTIPWIKSGDLNDGVIRQTEEFITNDGLENSAAKLLPPGTLTVALYGATIGKLGILDLEAATNQACANCRVDESIADKWIVFYYLLEQRKALIDAGQGGAQPNLSNQIVRDWPFPLPPLAEQKRIVAKVETLLARVNAARQRLAKVPALLKRFRQSVLIAACSGQLTEDWREKNRASDDTAKLVNGIHGSRSGRAKARTKDLDSAPLIDTESENIPDRWCITRIGDVTECLDHIRKPINKDARIGRHGNIPYYGANGQTGWIDEFLFDEDLVLVVEDESFIGREKPFSYVIRGKSWVNNHAHVLRPLGGMSAEYLNAMLAFYNFVPLTSGTTGRRKLNKKTLLEAPIVVAPLAEQHEIVLRVEALLARADRIEKRLATATRRVETLTQAILAQAFRGELVPTEAELARQEGREYEPAAVLLERIRAARAGAATGKRSKRSRPTP